MTTVLPLGKYFVHFSIICPH